MNQTIRSRIEQIKRGAIPDGYKKTKVGIVPKEWTEHTLSEFFVFKNGLNKEKEAFGKGTPIVNYTDVWGKRGLLKENIKGKVLLSKNEIDLYKVEEGDVFFTRTSETIEEIGLSSVLLEPINDCVFSGFVLRARPKKAGIVKEYNIYCYSSAIMRHEITRKSSMTTRALTNGTLLGEVNINLPNQKEQEKIAEILQEQDRLIELKEKLIEEKKKRKQYLVQQLLTKKLRLPGISEEWRNITLGECLQEVNLRTTENNQYEVLSVTREGIVRQKEQFNFQRASDNNIGYKVIKKNQVAFSVLNLWMGSVDILQSPEIGMISPAYKVFDCISNIIIPDFAKYFLRSAEMVWLYNVNSEIGASIVRKNLDLDGLLQSNVTIPKIPEQRAIAEVLSKADDELDLLQKELEEQKRKKQSLMQLLLTGIVKVKA